MMRLSICTCLFVLLVLTWGGPAYAQSDWDLYMLRLVNRSRLDPGGEPARIGSMVTDNRAPVQPLAYNLLIAQAAQNHTQWMLTNLGNPSIPNAGPGTIDSFSHSEVPGTADFTGVNVADPSNPDRFGAVGFDWQRAGENISTFFTTASAPFLIDTTQIDDLHKGWWESTGHRSNMLNGNFTAFGFGVIEGPVTPAQSDDSGLTQILGKRVKRIIFGTQNFGTPFFDQPETYIAGLLYDDKDATSDWTPRSLDDPLREGLADVPFEVYQANTATLVSSGMTMDNGAFSVNIGDGDYDLKFLGPFRGGALEQFVIEDVHVNGVNTVLDDIEINTIPLPVVLGDMDGNGVLDAFDVDDFESALADKQAYLDTHPGLDPDVLGDFDASGGLDAFDVDNFELALAGGGSVPVPEPGSLILLGVAGRFLLRRRHGFHMRRETC